MRNRPRQAAISRGGRPSSVSPQAAAFARDVIARAGPEGPERAKNLLWAAGKLADWALPLGLDAVPEVLLRPSSVERFTRCAPGLSGAARRTMRTNLRFIGRRVVPQLYPADMPLPRKRAQGPLPPGGDRRVPRAGGRPAHCGAADAGGGAGLPRRQRRADPRRPARRARRRCRLPVRWRRRPGQGPATSRGAGAAGYHARLLEAARFAGSALICGGADPGRRNITNPLIAALDGGGGLPRLDAGRLRAAWPAAARSCWGWRRSCARPGSAAPGGPAISSRAWQAGEAEAVRLLGAARPP